jgi:acetyl-CoA synthetase
MGLSGVSHAVLDRLALVCSNGSEMNACVATCDRWADGSRIGLEWTGRNGGTIVRTYGALRADAARFANMLTARGILPGDVVAGMLPPGPEMLIVILGTWRAGAVFQPIAAGSSSIATAARINHSGRPPPRLVVTDMENRGTLGLVKACPSIMVVTNGAPLRPGDADFMAELMGLPASFTPVARHGDDPFLLLVGGRGGQMRPVTPALWSLLGILSNIPIGREPDEAEIGWDVSDPAWSSDLYFSIIRPLLLGDTVTINESDRFAAAPLLPPLARDPFMGKGTGAQATGRRVADLHLVV